MPRLTRRHWLLLSLVIVVPIVAILFTKWREASNNGGQKPAQPFRIAGNLYYVGANDVTSFLITGPQGHVLIDGGYPGTAPMIIASIHKLGFDIKDVKILLNSHAHFDHAGGLKALQDSSGAQLWVSEGDADAVASGGDDPSLGVIRLLVWLRLAKFPLPRVDHRFKDGDTVRLGTTELIAHVTPGHTRGCTSWEIPLHENGRRLSALHVCSLGLPVSLSEKLSPETQAEFERTFTVLHALHPDIWVTSHARDFGRYRKFAARDTAKDSVAPFIDPDGYRLYVDSAEATFRRQLAKQKAQP